MRALDLRCGHARAHALPRRPAGQPQLFARPQLLYTRSAWQARAPPPVHAQAGVQAAQAGGGAGDNGDTGSSVVPAAAAEAAVATSSSDAAPSTAQQHAAPPTAAPLAAADASAAADAPAAAAPSRSPSASPEPGQRGGSNFAKRVVSGVLLGAAAAVIIAYGRLPFLATTLFVVYHATREYFGFLTSKGISQGMTPPPPFVSAVTTVLCLSIAALTHVTGIKSGTAMCVAAFLLLAVNVIANRKPTFSQLTSSVFGLFYCGARTRVREGERGWEGKGSGARGDGQWLCVLPLAGRAQGARWRPLGWRG
jgi:hypothetical protein